MTTPINHYAILGIANTATQDEVKKAYKLNALKYHPDRNVNKQDSVIKELSNEHKKTNPAFDYAKLSEAQQNDVYSNFVNKRFKEVNEANEILGDAAKRREYDLEVMREHEAQNRRNNFRRAHTNPFPTSVNKTSYYSMFNRAPVISITITIPAKQAGLFLFLFSMMPPESQQQMLRTLFINALQQTYGLNANKHSQGNYFQPEERPSHSMRRSR